MEFRILVFGLFLLLVHEAVSFEDDIIGISKRVTVPVHDVKLAVRYYLRGNHPESIVVTFNNTSRATFWFISNKSDYDYASNENPGIMSMSGILSALRHGLPENPLWVFTDKPVKDPVKYHEVVYMSQKMGNPIFFAIFGPRNHSITPAPGFSMYHDVAAATNGQVFYLQKNETGELLNYEEHLRSRPKDVVFTKTFSPDVENNLFSVNVDSKISELTIAVTGEAENPAVTVTDPSGLAVATTDVTRISAITVVKLPVHPGVYKVQVSSPREKRVVVTACTPLTFQHGFSAHTPSDFKETSRIPVSGMGHLSILLDNEEGLELRSVQILDMDSTVLVEAPVQPVFVVDESATATPRLYTTDITIPDHTFQIFDEDESATPTPRFYTTYPITIPDHTFQIAINIHDASSGTNLTRHGSTPITPSLASKCQQPLDSGPCRAAVPKWYYDNSLNICSHFTYGGCAGNENRFPSEAECNRECAAAPPEPPAPEVGAENGVPPSPTPKTHICPKDQFACSKNPVPTCIPNSWVCDGAPDCPDGEDEHIDECRNSQCAPNMFRCPSGKCLLKSFVCDGQNDCSDTDASDEKNCTTSHHSPAPRPENADVPSNAKCQQPMDAGPCRREFPKWYYDNSLNICRQFTYGGCLGNENRFPSEAECSRECAAAPPEPPAPEVGAENSIPPSPTPKTNICPEDQFACSKNTVPTCIPNSWVCDGAPDCPDGEDEHIDECRNSQCAPNMFRCPSGKCLLKSFVCDGQNDCYDLEASDEKNCTTSHHSPAPRPENADVPSNGTCLSWMVTCGNNNCIPHWWRCDGMNDCGDNSDEVGCENAKCQQPMDAGPCRAALHKWYYDNSLNICRQFAYGGCLGNENRFPSEAECSRACAAAPPEPPAPEVGAENGIINEPIPNTTEHQNRKLAATDKTLNMQKNICRQRDDELETFGRYVASSLRKLNEKVAINAQDEIQAILSKYKLRNLKRTSN